MDRLKWMPSISLFWVFALLIVQCSDFAICIPPGIVHSNNLPICFCWCRIRGTHQIRLLAVDTFFVGSILKRQGTWYNVWGWVISWLACRRQVRCNDWRQNMMAWVIPSWQMLNFHGVIALHSLISGNVVAPGPPFCCCWIISIYS